MFEVRLVEDARATLGEGPVWDAARGVLWWVDIKRHRVLAHDPDLETSRSWTLPGQIGCLGLADHGRLIVALENGLHLFDPATEGLERFGTLAPEAGTIRFNDGKIGPGGRFWVGTLDDEADFPPLGQLYRVTPDGRHDASLSELRCPNGIGWTGDGTRMFYTDSMRRTIWSFAHDPQTGALDDRQVFATVPEPAVPDGLAVDEDGYVWSAHWDGAAVFRYAPDGSTDMRIEIPVPRPTSCCFGGPGLKTLYVTSASIDLEPDVEAAAPLSGGLFAIDTPLSGVPVGVFGAAR